jgi:hypothetical protein
MTTCIRIERLEPRPGKSDQAYQDRRGYQLGNPKLSSKERKLVANAKFVSTLDEAAHWVENEGWHIRMGDSWRDASLIQPSQIRAIKTAYDAQQGCRKNYKVCLL